MLHEKHGCLFIAGHFAAYKKIAFLQEFVNFYFIVVFLFPPSKHVWVWNGMTRNEN